MKKNDLFPLSVSLSAFRRQHEEGIPLIIFLKKWKGVNFENPSIILKTGGILNQLIS